MSDAVSVLIVDDDEESRTPLAALLETLGYRAETAASGLQALARLQGAGTDSRPPPDVLLLDVMMPDLDGLETLKRYRASGGQQPVLMISALDEASTALQAVRMGANDYLTKPFDPDELREILDRVVGRVVDAPRRAAPADGAARPGPQPSSVARSPAMRRVADLIERIADVDVPILITGESG